MTATPRRVVRRIFGSLGYVVSGKAGAGIISLGYLMLAAPYLGPTEFGVLVLVHGYAILVGGIVAFPASQAVVRYGAMALEAGDAPRLARLLRFGAGIELTAAVLALAAAASLAPLAGRVLGWPAEAMALAGPYSIAVLATAGSTPMGFLQLSRRFDLIGVQNLVPPTVRLVGAGIVVALDLGLTGFLIAWMTAAFAEWVTIWGMGLWMARARLGPLLLRPGAGAVRAENPGIWPFMIVKNIDTTLRDLAGRAAPLIVGSVLGPAAAGLFSVAQRATVVLVQPGMMLGSTAYAEFAHVVVQDNPGPLLRRALRRMMAIMLGVALPLVVVLALLSDEVVRLLAGEAFLAAAPLMIWLLAAQAVGIVTPMSSAALTAMGRPSISLYTNLTAGLVFLTALPFLLDRFGLVGAGVQALAQAFSVALVMVLTTDRLCRRLGR